MIANGTTSAARAFLFAMEAPVQLRLNENFIRWAAIDNRILFENAQKKSGAHSEWNEEENAQRNDENNKKAENREKISEKELYGNTLSALGYHDHRRVWRYNGGKAKVRVRKRE